MRYSENWKDYQLIDASDGERLECWGDIILIRPDPQIIWKSERQDSRWHSAHARYIRSSSGGGSWDIRKAVPDMWRINYRDIAFNVKPMGFKHVGIFPEQAVNWDWMQKKISTANREINVLNLFAYTGGATLACLKAGANVCHVDASKGMTMWARENAALSGLSEVPQRWIVDDCLKFVRREIRREKKYDAIIMDPPSYGRGPGGEIWKIEEQIYALIELCAQLLSDNPLFFIINSYTTGLSPSVMSYISELLLCPSFGGRCHADEIGLPVSNSGLVLPCGSTAIWERN